ncbi:hypothetical protein AB5J62_10875 [Amycolatopsis sp. cg5]
MANAIAAIAMSMILAFWMSAAVALVSLANSLDWPISSSIDL